MGEKQGSINANLQPVSAKMMVVQGVVQNLPEILGSIKEIYRLNKKSEVVNQVLQSRLDEMNINKENFNVLVLSLTELSKAGDADEETKTMYRDMIKTLFEIFTTNMRSSQDVSSYLNEL